MAGLLDKAKTASNDEPKSSKKPEPKADSGTLLSQSKPVVSNDWKGSQEGGPDICLLYTSPSPRDKRQSRMPSSA